MTSAADGAARWARVQDLLHRALDLPEERRAPFLDEACGDDRTLRDEVLSLLVHADNGVLGEPDDTPRLFGMEAERFGPYRILRPLGEGGMGAVYLAERTGTDFTQIVALKLIRAGFAIPAGLMPTIKERFARERRILARLEHPGIARLIDGGYTPSGQAYLAMEFVEGLPLTAYARQHALTIRARLELFLDICDAVQYAHGQLVIHRDLKPSNILVSEHGSPKLLDFGIASFAEGDEAEPRAQPSSTRTGLWLTPNYASPEQIRRERVTALSDVYSLGVVLYELLADMRPYEVSDVTPAGLEEVVCRRIPERPSARVGESRLARRLRGDLDTIILKALAKEPARRYGSVRELADDVRRHLRREPVLARPDSIGYRAVTFLRRNRTAVAAGAVVVATLLGGITTTAWQARTASRARDRAEAALAQSEEVTSFLISLYEENDPQRAPVDPALAEAMLERGVARAEELAESPAVRARLLDALGMVFLNLGRSTDAHRLVGQALAIRLELFGSEHPDAALSLAHQGWVHRFLGEYSESVTLLNQALRVQRRLLPPDDPAIEETMHRLAFMLPYIGRSPEAEILYRELLALRQRKYGAEHPRVADVLRSIAGALRLQGRTVQAESVAHEVLEMRRRVLEPGHPDIGADMVVLADYVAQDSTRWVDAESLYRDGIEIQRRALGDRHLNLVHGLGNLADLLVEQQRYEEAMQLTLEVMAIRRERLGEEHESVLVMRDEIADILAAQGNLDGAIAQREVGLATWRERFGPDHPHVAGSMSGLARLYTRAGRYAEAESLLVATVEIRRERAGPTHALVGLTLMQLGELNTERGHFAEAEPQLLEALRVIELNVGATGSAAVRARDALVRLYEAWGRHEDADRFR